MKWKCPETMLNKDGLNIKVTEQAEGKYGEVIWSCRKNE